MVGRRSPNQSIRFIAPDDAGCGERSLNGPARGLDSVVQGRSRQSCTLGPLSYRQRLTIVREALSLAQVPHLLVACRPATVLWAVGTVVISTIQRSSVWARSHVLQELRIATSPRVAHDDPSPTVVLVGVIGRIVASALCRCPYTVDLCALATVFPCSLFTTLVVEATTAFCLALEQARSAGCRCRSTITSTQPTHLPKLVVCPATQYFQAAEALACQVVWSHGRSV